MSRGIVPSRSLCLSFVSSLDSFLAIDAKKESASGYENFMRINLLDFLIFQFLHLVTKVGPSGTEM